MGESNSVLTGPGIMAQSVDLGSIWDKTKEALEPFLSPL